MEQYLRTGQQEQIRKSDQRMNNFVWVSRMPLQGELLWMWMTTLLAQLCDRAYMAIWFKNHSWLMAKPFGTCAKVSSHLSIPGF